VHSNRFDYLVSNLTLRDQERALKLNCFIQFVDMGTWLRNTKEIKFTVGTCDSNDTEVVEPCANGARTISACCTVPVEQLSKITMDWTFSKILDKRSMARLASHMRVVN
jgi:hypothetical protein